VNLVLDTSVLIAAFYRPVHGPSFSREVYDYVSEHFTVHLSAYILEEFRRKSRLKLHLPRATIRAMESVIRSRAELTQVRHLKCLLPETVHLRDPKDHPILELALNVQATLLLTWDKDLLSLKDVLETRIVSPRQFWDSLS
jgi:putative PIN family toxin of toxin-antitoxin system